MVRLVVLAFLVLLFLAFRFLPFRVTAAGFVLLVVAVYLGRKAILQGLFLLPFRAKGRALRRATAEVHEVAPAPEGAPAEPAKPRAALTPAEVIPGDGGPPIAIAAGGDGAEGAHGAPAGTTGSEDDEDEDRPVPVPGSRRFLLDVTIRPDPSAQRSFRHWELGELRLAPPGAKGPMHEEDDSLWLEKLEVFMDGRFQPDEGWKLPGPHRIRAFVTVPPNVTTLRFRYYFEEFGEIRIPS